MKMYTSAPTFCYGKYTDLPLVYAVSEQKCIQTDKRVWNTKHKHVNILVYIVEIFVLNLWKIKQMEFAIGCVCGFVLTFLKLCGIKSSKWMTDSFKNTNTNHFISYRVLQVFSCFDHVFSRFLALCDSPIFSALESIDLSIPSTIHRVSMMLVGHQMPAINIKRREIRKFPFLQPETDEAMNIREHQPMWPICAGSITFDIPFF